MLLKIKKLHSDAKAPVFAYSGDAGADLYATSKVDGYGYIEYGIGIAIEIPEGHVGLLFPRSSVSDTSLALSNSVGVIDSGFRGEIKLRFREINALNHEYNVGDRVGQLVIIKHNKFDCVMVSELSDSGRSENRFGSSGQ
jgi:dUTP pyrophosphatase